VYGRVSYIERFFIELLPWTYVKYYTDLLISKCRGKVNFRRLFKNLLMFLFPYLEHINLTIFNSEKEKKVNLFYPLKCVIDEISINEYPQMFFEVLTSVEEGYDIKNRFLVFDVLPYLYKKAGSKEKLQIENIIKEGTWYLKSETIFDVIMED
jgi:hypothetical protein